MPHTHKFIFSSEKTVILFAYKEILCIICNHKTKQETNQTMFLIKYILDGGVTQDHEKS